MARSARKRCAWARNPLAIAYHDREWGVPVREDRKLFEFLILEGAQAGLSWDTILAKRENYRRAFDRFDPRKVARYGAAKKRRLLADAVVRAVRLGQQQVAADQPRREILRVARVRHQRPDILRRVAVSDVCCPGRVRRGGRGWRRTGIPISASSSGATS